MSARSPDAWLSYLLGGASDNAVIVLDSAGTIVQWLGGSERRFGYTEEEALGLDVGVLFTSEDCARGLDRQEMAVAAATNRSEDDRWHVRKDGSRFWGSGLLEAVRETDGSVSGYCKVLRDRTDLRTQLDALQNRVAFREEELARRANALASLGHELRNMLGPLLNATSTISRTNDPQTRSNSVAVLNRQLATMEALLDDLDDSPGAGAAVPKLRIESVVLREAMEVAVSGIRPTVEQKRQTLTLTAPSVPISLEVDPSRLQQMLLNLLSNASKYTPAGGRIHLTATVEGSEAVVRVTDDGMGISAEVLPHIFDLFTRGDPAPGVAGSGVGLAIVKQFATLHGGGVEARSAGAGKGSVFVLRLPLDGPRRADTRQSTSP